METPVAPFSLHARFLKNTGAVYPYFPRYDTCYSVAERSRRLDHWLHFYLIAQFIKPQDWGVSGMEPVLELNG